MSKAATELVAQSWNKFLFPPHPKLGRWLRFARETYGGGDYAQESHCAGLRAGTHGKETDPGAEILGHPAMAARAECLSGYLWLGARLGKEGKAIEAVQSL